MTDYFQLAYLYTVHLSPNNIAPLFGFAGAGVTLSKTTIWVLQEHFCGHCSSENVDPTEILKFWIAPNVWVPAMFTLESVLTQKQTLVHFLCINRDKVGHRYYPGFEPAFAKRKKHLIFLLFSGCRWIECPDIDFLDFILHLRIFYARLRFSLPC